MSINIKRDCNGECLFRWWMSQSPYYTFILWSRNFILTEHIIKKCINHVHFPRQNTCFPYVPFTYSVHNLSHKITGMSCISYVHVCLPKRASPLNGLRAYGGETHTRAHTLIYVLHTSVELIATYHLVHKQLMSVHIRNTANSSIWRQLRFFWN
jgi:hypothetical protein